MIPFCFHKKTFDARLLDKYTTELVKHMPEKTILFAKLSCDPQTEVESI